MTSQGWIDETSWNAAEELLPEQSPHIFMESNHIDGGEMRSRLNEYRASEGNLESPWVNGRIDMLTTDFLNWNRWER